MAGGDLDAIVADGRVGEIALLLVAHVIVENGELFPVQQHVVFFSVVVMRNGNAVPDSLTTLATITFT